MRVLSFCLSPVLKPPSPRVGAGNIVAAVLVYIPFGILCLWSLYRKSSQYLVQGLAWWQKRREATTTPQGSSTEPNEIEIQALGAGQTHVATIEESKENNNVSAASTGTTAVIENSTSEKIAVEPSRADISEDSV